MMEHPEHLTSSNDEGVRRVVERNGQYAFLMESSTIEYVKEQHCELAQIGSLLDNKNYGIATRKSKLTSSPLFIKKISEYLSRSNYWIKSGC